MKKVFVFVFALAVFACVAVVAILASSNDGRTTQTPQTNADKQTLEIVVQEQVTLVHEQSAQLYYHVNIPEATLQLTQQDPQIVLIDNSFKIYATQVGQTTCTITAQINQQTVSKNIVIIVEPKQVEFSCNKNAFFCGQKSR